MAARKKQQRKENITAYKGLHISSVESSSFIDFIYYLIPALNKYKNYVLENKNKEHVLAIILNSYGGSISDHGSLAEILLLFKNELKKHVKFSLEAYVINSLSAGDYILCICDKRYSFSNASFLFHNAFWNLPEDWGRGTRYQDIIYSAKRCKVDQEKHIKFVNENFYLTNKEIGHNILDKLIDPKVHDTWYNTEEMIKYHIIDDIVDNINFITDNIIEEYKNGREK